MARVLVDLDVWLDTGGTPWNLREPLGYSAGSGRQRGDGRGPC